jgi:tetratricopeptide (TPR) repeat protein
LGYYFSKGRGTGKALNNRRKHVLWVIKNHPGAELAALPYCGMDGVFDPEGYVEAKKLWLKQTEAHPQDPMVLGHAAAFFTISDTDLAEGFLKRAQKADPENATWSDRLGHLYSMADDKEAALKSLAEYEKAQASDRDQMSKSYRLDDLAKAAIKAEDLEKATIYAKEALDGVERFPKDWNHGNAIHHANNVLGLVALKQADMKSAAAHLLKAGKTPGSPQLDSFGPNMSLAKALLEKGGKDTVLEYFELCRKFWEMGGDRLDQWTKDVKAGNIPDFGGNLAY